MADAYEYVAATGVVIPDTGDTKAQVEAEYKGVFGEDLNVNQGPQQVLIAAETTQRQGVARNNAALANQINPDLAGGVFLDAIWKLTGGTRRAATKSTIAGVVLTGVAGTFIPAGSEAATGAGIVFASAADVTLGVGGTATVDFVATENGPLVANPGTLTTVVSAVLGWETVTNPNAAVPGLSEETDAASRLRRRNTLALQGNALSEAITSALYNVEGVRSLSFRENPAPAAATIDGFLMDPHSFRVVVDGGTDADVAAAIFRSRSGGSVMMGAVTVAYVDPFSSQSYAVKFTRPTAVPFLVRATVRTGSVAGDVATIVKDAILTYTAGLMDGESGFVVGGAVSPFELAGAVSRQAPGIYVQKMEVAPSSTGIYQTTEYALTISQLATLDAANIAVVFL